MKNTSHEFGFTVSSANAARLRRRRGVESLVKLISLGLAVSAIAISASLSSAADLQWGGLYRFQGVRIDNPELKSDKSEKAYMLHHLILQPKIVAA
ncbi:MAG: hypothetical protein U1E10_13805, partial [Bdellovibrionales bacterium]|nr:hypothetical protein [Bdellovibrionales bacterium]